MGQHNTHKQILDLVADPEAHHTYIGPHKVNCLDLLLWATVLTLVSAAFLLLPLKLGHRLIMVGVFMLIWGGFLWFGIKRKGRHAVPDET